MRWLFDLFRKKKPVVPVGVAVSKAVVAVSGPRAPRVDVFTFHQLTFQISGMQNALQVVDLSVSGVALVWPAAMKLPVKGAKIAGVLVIGGQKFQTELEVARTGMQRVGARFFHTGTELVKAIERYFAVELAAAGVREIPRASIEWDAGGAPQWFYTSAECGLFYVLDGIRIREFWLILFEHCFKGGEGGRTHYAQLVGASTVAPPRFVMPEVRAEAVPGSEAVGLAVRFVSNIRGLPAEHRQIIAQLLKR
jgi:hypothetical protein